MKEKTKDALLKKFFEADRWNNAVHIAFDKGINKLELKKLCSPSVRIWFYKKIKNGAYEIAPPHQLQIPKDNGDFRTVYINENLDRVFLSIANNLLLESCKDMIHPSCKSYQTGIGCGKVVKETSHYVHNTEGEIIGFKADLTKYFDSVEIGHIDHIFDEVEKRTGKSKIIDVLRTYYYSNLCFDANGNLINQYQSLKQGCAVAAFLANVMLYHIDKKLSEFPGYYVRYSDDILYIGKDYKMVKKILTKELNKMGLTLNPKKVELLMKNKWFKFLGFLLKDDLITISKTRLKDFQMEIEKRTIHRKWSLRQAVNAVNHYLYKGDGQYSWATSVLPIINVQKDIDTLNVFVMDSLRAVKTRKNKIGGLGSVNDRPDYTILRGKGKNVRANREKTEKEINGFYSLQCMRNALLTNREVFNTLVRMM